jgi:hypothetical protein
MSIVEQQWLDLRPDAYAAPKRGPLDKAHPYHPGSGPKGQTCGICSKLCRVEYHNKTYRKCHVLMRYWSHGPGTDIRCKDAACKSWEPATEKLELVTTRHRTPRIDY